MTTISANIICKNEKETIRECVESVLPYVDEVIVIDTGSTDGTLEILKEYDVSVHQIDWNDDFASMRNQCKSLSNGDWIFILDADMKVLNFEKPDFSDDYYTGDITVLTRSNNLVAFPYICLFKKEFDYIGKRHATIESAVKGKKGKHINVVVSHPELSQEEIKEKMIRNLPIHLEQLKTEPENHSVIYHLFRTYYFLKDYGNAIKYGIDVLNSSLNVQTKAMTSIFLYLIYSHKNQRDIGVPYLVHSVELVPYQIFGRFLMFDLFCELDKGLAGETLDEIKLLLKSKKSDLPCDYFLNEIQLLQLESKLKGLQCQTTEQ